MILDSGICTAFRRVDVAEKGRMPRYEYQRIAAHWYGELDFATVLAFPTEGREEVQTDARIRILQDRRINNHDVIILANAPKVEDTLIAYEITRAFHGKDDDSGELITDLTLKRIRP